MGKWYAVSIGLLIMLSTPGCVTLSYHDQKVREAFDLGYNIGAPQMKECADRLAKFNQYIQGMQRPQSAPVPMPSPSPKK